MDATIWTLCERSIISREREKEREKERKKERKRGT
jgi:hypothetical protein